jgi:hypothetical protein
MHQKNEDRREVFAALFLILVVAGVSYILLARRFGFYGDDWYLVYGGVTEGWKKFFEIFASDRPFRAYFVGPVFNLLGLNAPLYSYFSYFLRVIEALGAFWLIRLIWPQQKRLSVLLGVLFIVYPGWIDQPAAFDYQSHLLAYALEIFSLVFAVIAFQTPKRSLRVLMTVLAVLGEVISFLLMEYYIGLEGLRFLILLYLCSGPGRLKIFKSFKTFPHSVWQVIWRGLPYWGAAAAFLFWRSFLFNGSREATNLGSIMGSLTGSPLMRGLWSLVLLVQDFFNVTVMAWFVPVYQTGFSLRLRDTLIAIALGAGMAILVWVVWTFLKRSAPDLQKTSSTDPDGLDMLLIGSLGVIFSLIPIILGDRHIVFPTFARFTLTGSIGAILVLGGLFAMMRQSRLPILFSTVLIGLAVMAHYGNSVTYAENWSEMRDFWWQVSWRAPQIQPGTVLVADYPNAGIPEDYLVWGPANLIYYPVENRPENKTTTPLNAVVLTQQIVQEIQLGRTLSERERRSITSSQDLSKLLVMTMPIDGSCVHVIDGKQPELSNQEDASTYLIASASQVERIQTESASHLPPQTLFGAEPSHLWCYYYEKASLARQQGNWPAVAQLGDEAMAQGLHPMDWVEWMPFFQAYAYLGRTSDADKLVPILADNAYLKRQACTLFTADTRAYAEQYPEAQQYMREKFCQ